MTVFHTHTIPERCAHDYYQPTLCILALIFMAMLPHQFLDDMSHIHDYLYSHNLIRDEVSSYLLVDPDCLAHAISCTNPNHIHLIGTGNEAVNVKINLVLCS